mgnify:CR=1 FL=1
MGGGEPALPDVDPALSFVGSLLAEQALPSIDRLEFETLISDLSSSFINLPPGEVDREIEEALRRVCELLGIDLAVLWQCGVKLVTGDFLKEAQQFVGQ